MYLARIPVRRADGTKRFYYVLRHTEWSKKEKRQIQRYVAYIGPKPVITLDKAKALAKKLKMTVDELRRQVKGLKIINEGEASDD